MTDEYTDQEVLELVIENEKYEAYLKSTDWLVVRNFETGEPIPQLVLEKRAEARQSIVAIDLVDIVTGNVPLIKLLQSHGITDF
jgi:hypothetical protein